MFKAKIGDKVRIVNADKVSEDLYGNGAEGFITKVDQYSTKVKFTKGWSSDAGSQLESGFTVFYDEFEIINDEPKVLTKKEKEVEKEIKIKNSVYAVVNVSSGQVQALDFTREDARDTMNMLKKPYSRELKIVKMVPGKFVR